LQHRAEPATRMAGFRSVEIKKESAALGRYVSLMTMENAIGLEFRAAIIVGCEANCASTDLPYVDKLNSRFPQTLKFDPLLLYTACTRARERLIITSSGPITDLLTAALSPLSQARSGQSPSDLGDKST
jgi:superfamily I DNA/RNA helicase